MKLVWDEVKRDLNRIRHGLDFAVLDEFSWDRATIVPAREGRYKAVGRLDERIVTVIFKRLGREALSVISFRPASTRERQIHGEHSG